MYRIFIVEDDAIIAREMKQHLETWGNEIAIAAKFADLMPELISFDPQLVLMDIKLPYFNGYHWCSEIRKISKVPVIFLSSASDTMDIIMAISMGGDDFIAKPFDLHVLTAKVQALLRRTYDFAGTATLLEHKGAMLNLSNASLTYQKQQIELTKNELRILQLLWEHKGKAVSREALMTHLWETDSYIDDNTLTVNITRLRRKLEGIGLADLISTKKGLGYLFE